jgi:hypothetical protein
MATKKKAASKKKAPATPKKKTFWEKFSALGNEPKSQDGEPGNRNAAKQMPDRKRVVKKKAAKKKAAKKKAAKKK